MDTAPTPRVGPTAGEEIIAAEAVLDEALEDIVTVVVRRVACGGGGAEFRVRYGQTGIVVPSAQSATSVLRLWMVDGTIPQEHRVAARKAARIVADYGRKQPLSPRARLAAERLAKAGVRVP
ncbi:hypothetical protein [Sinomonas mesophila]|uniref:hypothetical protein n=1 Tax=Sinomonas mesophila TaxID=1531955 RepID=UPI000985FBBD|nr:hypothetical protein [Sinomonas mesophila]